MPEQEPHDPRLQHVSAAVPMEDQLVEDVDFDLHIFGPHPHEQPQDDLPANDHPAQHRAHHTQPPATQMSWGTGTFEGRDHWARFRLRIDHSTISGDIFRISLGHPSETWLASFRTTAWNTAEAGFAVIAEDRDGRTSQGILALQNLRSDLMMTLLLDTPLDGIPFGRSMHAPLEKKSDRMRELEIAVLREQNVAFLGDVNLNDAPYSLETAFEHAGFGARVIERGEIALPERDGWSEKSMANLMVDARTRNTALPSWLINLCWFSKSNRSGLLGVMFDTQDAQQRQWCAVYANEIRKHYADNVGEAALLKTMMHEIGHSLNLVHRFEREVGQKNSHSIMNYDWKYKGGDREGFWRNFSFGFDEDELQFLRHGPRNAVMPGGANFRAARYWKTGQDGYAPYRPEQLMTSWKLEIKPPNPPVLFFGQPVTLGIVFQNNGLDALELPRGFLDQKSGALQFEIKREGGPTKETHADHHGHMFHPLVHRLVDHSAKKATMITIPTGGTVAANANLTFGSGGFAFAEPGNYQVTAYLSFLPKGGSTEIIVRSQTIRLRISMPQTRKEENAALALTDPAAGQFFAYGGLPALHETQSKLLEVAEELTNGHENSKNPVAAHIFRAVAFGSGRQHLQSENGQVQIIEPDMETKLKHLERVVNHGLASFDPVTAQETKQHFDKLTLELADDTPN